MMHAAKENRQSDAFFAIGPVLMAICAPALIVGEFFDDKEQPGVLIVAGFVCLAFAAFLWRGRRWIRETRYEITPMEIKLRTGPFCTSLPLRDLVHISPARFPFSLPWQRVECLAILYLLKNGRKRITFVMPEDQRAFLDDLDKMTNVEKLGADDTIEWTPGRPE
jgi:hypothetical protein